MAHLTQKERMLLQDQLSHEEICIKKYSGYASRAKDPQVRNMFNEFASEEQQHYNTIQNLLQGQGQAMGQGQMQAGKKQQAGSQGAGWQATWQSGLTGNLSQAGSQIGSQTGTYQATAGNQQMNAQMNQQTNQQGNQQFGNQQGWLAESRTIYGGQVSQGNQGSQFNQPVQSTSGTGGRNKKSATNFEAGSEFSVSTGDDKSMLNDMLMTEKYVSGAYDTAVFEAANPQVRQVLQHIQRDEQKHGERIFQYMQQNGMYQPQ